MLGIALLVFREVLEAALIVTIVAAATRGVVGRARFIGGGIGLGVVGAVIVALFAGAIADAVGGSGQELFNACVLLAAVLMIGWHVIWMSSHGRELTQQMQAVGQSVKAGSSSLAMLLAVVALAVLREGSEIVLFLYGMAAGGAGKADLFLGIPVGIAGGVAVGFALYFGLLRIPLRYFFSATNWMLILLAAGLASTAARFLIQANWLPAWDNQVWNTSALLDNGSVVGKAMHILVGYDARPAGMQIAFWLVTVIVLVSGMRWMTRGHVASSRAAQTVAPQATA
ncbi:MAG: iron permease [Xanthomonadales bacterium PRO7]|jgi:high-affinity iron transporter|nr:iron permease [Xanthomonadales bacterium PRO7]HMM57399.1 FTR1 family protein [Rudaea sp.]